MCSPTNKKSRSRPKHEKVVNSKTYGYEIKKFVGAMKHATGLLNSHI